MRNLFTLFKSIITGLATGIGICIPLGPAGIESIKRTISEDFFEGFKVSLGAISADMAYLLIINLGLSELFLKNSRTEGLFWVGSGLLLFMFTFISNNTSEKKLLNGSNISVHPFPTGFMITFLNPLTPSLWLALTGTVISMWRNTGYLFLFSFILSILCGMICWFALLNFLAAKGIKKLTPDMTNKTSSLLKYVLLITGIAFMIFGIYKLFH